MSDLAPFVAAVLRDQSNADLMQENAALRQELSTLRQEHRSVTITGPRGTPIYAKAQVEDGYFGTYDFGTYDEMGITWIVRLVPQVDEHGEVVSCPPSRLVRSEVRLSGIFVASFLGSRSNHFNTSNNHGSFIYPMMRGSGQIRGMAVTIGPFTSEQAFNDFYPHHYRYHPPPPGRDDGAFQEGTQDVTVVFDYVKFHPEAIRHMVDNFDQRLNEYNNNNNNDNIDG